MRRNTWHEVLSIVIASFGAAACAQEAPPVEIALIATEPQPPAPPDSEPRFVLVDGGKEADNAPQGEYWLGVQIAALPEVVKKQLAVEHGLAVEEVSADSPAAKAEIKKYDILVKADNKPLNAYGDLIKVVEDSEGKEIVITIVRGGKDATVKVAPVKRPQAARVEIRAPRPEIRAEIKGLEEALENLKNKMGKDGASLWFPKPAIVAPRVEMKFDHKWTKETTADFPKDLKVQINKQGNEPAEVHVQRGEKNWNLNEDKLDELPDDIRDHVQQMLGRKGPMFYTPGKTLHVTPEGKVQGAIRIAPTPPVPPQPAAAPRAAAAPAPVPSAAPRGPTAPAPPTPPRATRTLPFRTERADDGDDSKLDAILKKLEKIEGGTLDKLDKDVKQMRKEIDDLRKKSPSDGK